MLQVVDLAISFGGVAAVKGVSLTVGAGEFVGLIGPNGAGKTTLLRLMTGVLTPDRGRVRFADQDITRMSVDQRARLGFVMTHQIVRPFRQMTLLENATLAAGHALTRQPWLALWRTDARAAQVRAQQELERVGIADAAHKLASQVPLGYLKRFKWPWPWRSTHALSCSMNPWQGSTITRPSASPTSWSICTNRA